MNSILATLKARTVDDIGRFWRWWSIQLHAFMGLWLALYEIAPVLPKEIAGMLPSPFQAQVIGAYSALGIILRLIAQPKKKLNG